MPRAAIWCNLKTNGNGAGVAYGYDAMSRLTSLTLSGANANAITLGNYNPADQLGSRTQSNDGYAWTAAANGSRGYTADGLNRYTAIGGVAQSHDARGDMTSAYGSLSYTYNSRNLPVQAAGGFGGTTAYYNPLGRLDALDAEQRWLDYDGGEVMSELNSTNGAIVRRYVFGPGVDEPLVWYEGGAKTFMDADERGSIVRGSDAAGAGVFVNQYDESGVGTFGNQGRFQYEGQLNAGALGLADFKARMYLPDIGRFMQTDPVGRAGGANLYAFAGGDPVNGSDPSGLAAVLPGKPPQGENNPNPLPSNTEASSDIVVTLHRDKVALNAELNSTRANVGGVARTLVNDAGLPQRVNSKTRKLSPCEQATLEPGQVSVASLSGSAYLLFGLAGAIGSFTNLKTGTHGYFVTLGGGAGLGESYEVNSGFYRSLADLSGFNATAAYSNIVVSGTASFNSNGEFVGSTAAVGLGIGGGAVISQTHLFQCTLGH